MFIYFSELLTYKNTISQSIGAEPGFEPESEAAYPGALPHYPDYAILHHFYTHTRFHRKNTYYHPNKHYKSATYINFTA